jgi:SAM-dependent methyltransferase
MTSKESSATNLPAPAQLMQLIWPGAMAAQAIYVAAKLGIADLIKDGPQQVDALQQATGTHPASLHRLLRALTSLGLFSETEEGVFQNTELSETLRSDQPRSMRPWAIFLGSPLMWKPWGNLYETVLTGKPAVDHVYGKPFFTYLAENPDDAAIFNAAMTARSEMNVPPILSAYDFSHFELVVDVGGGQGALLRGILLANPNVRGVIFDFPGVVSTAAALMNTELADRCEVIGGDFFESVPEGADAYVLKGIIHDWNDDDALKILKNCRRAIRNDGRLLLFETILKPSGQPDPGSFMDVLMLTLVGGQERTEPDFRGLLQKAGFELTRVVPTEGGPYIIESRPI